MAVIRSPFRGPNIGRGPHPHLADRRAPRRLESDQQISSCRPHRLVSSPLTTHRICDRDRHINSAQQSRQPRQTGRYSGPVIQTPAAPGRDRRTRSAWKLWHTTAEIGAKVASHGRYITFRMAELAVSRQMFADVQTACPRPACQSDCLGTRRSPHAELGF